MSIFTTQLWKRDGLKGQYYITVIATRVANFIRALQLSNNYRVKGQTVPHENGLVSLKDPASCHMLSHRDSPHQVGICQDWWPALEAQLPV